MWNDLTYDDYARFLRLPVDELARQCRAEAFHASGPGGQGVNTADSAVRMRHVPTGITVVSRESRSQLQNRERCLQKIRSSPDAHASQRPGMRLSPRAPPSAGVWTRRTGIPS